MTTANANTEIKKFETIESFNIYDNSRYLSRVILLKDGTSWKKTTYLDDTITQISNKKYEELKTTANRCVNTSYYEGYKSSIKLTPVDFRGEETISFNVPIYRFYFLDEESEVREHFYKNEKWLRSQEINFLFGLTVQNEIGQWDRLQVLYTPERAYDDEGSTYAFFKDNEVHIATELNVAYSLIEIETISTTEFLRREAANAFSPEGRKAYYAKRGEEWYKKACPKAVKDSLTEWQVEKFFSVVEKPWEQVLYTEAIALSGGYPTLYNEHNYLLQEGEVICVIYNQKTQIHKKLVLSKEEQKVVLNKYKERKKFGAKCSKLAKKYGTSWKAVAKLKANEEEVAKYAETLKRVQAEAKPIPTWMREAFTSNLGRPSLYRAMKHLGVTLPEGIDELYFDWRQLHEILKKSPIIKGNRRKHVEIPEPVACVTTLGEVWPG